MQGDFEQARKYYYESLEIRLEIEDRLGIVSCIVGFAEIANFENLNNLATYLLGFVESTLQSIDCVLDGIELKQYKQTITRLHEQLSDEEFNKYWEEGKKLTLDEAVELALKLEKND